VISDNHFEQGLCSRWRCRIASALLVVVLIALSSFSQTDSNTSRGVVRLRARVRLGDSTKGLARKRFYLVKGTLQQNEGWLQMSAQLPLISRECFYRQQGATENLIAWLKEHDCESVYCREIELKDVEGASAVPEFQRAFATGEREFNNRELALKWLTVNLPDNIRDRFYQANQQRLAQLLSAAEMTSGSRAYSAMTDRNGTAYFTDLEPGTYVLSNLTPTQVGETAVTWNCELEVKRGDVATEKPFLISNRKDKNVKCVGIERPLPSCDSKKQSETSSR
jgi:hypothetical protein